MTGELSTAREVLAAGLLVGELAAMAFVAAVVTTRVLARDPLVRALAWVLLVIGQAIGVPMVLGMVGLLRLPFVVLLHVALALGAVVLRRRAAVDRPLQSKRWWSPVDLVAVGASTLYVGLGSILSLDPQRSLEFDTKEYHLANLASWLQDGHIWGLPYSQPGSMTANHPSSGELFGLWLALPTNGDELVYLAPVVFGLLAILAGTLLGRELAADHHGAALGALATAAVLTAPIYFAQVDSLLTDLIAAAAVLTAVAFLVLAARSASPPAHLVVLAGVGLGIGVGSKYTALLPGLVLAATAIALLRRSRVWWWLVPGLLLFAAPWYLRNIFTTGNPLFPQPIGPIEGARSPYDVLDTSMLDHLLEGETGILRTAAELARDFLGPLLALIALGLVAPLLAWRREASRILPVWIAGFAAVALALYAATPYTGGGPTGLSFIIVSCFRYALIGVLVAAVVAAAVAPRWLVGSLLGVTLAWNLWEIARNVRIERAQLEVSTVALALAIALAVVTVGLVHLASSRTDWLRRVPVAPGVAVLVLVGVLASTAAYHRLDRGRTPTVLESTLLVLGADEPAVVTGVADLRAVLGPRLERPLVKVSRGGAADEIPFADEAQLRRRVLGEEGTDPPPVELGEALDRAVEEADTTLLVVGGVSPTGYPDGWMPSDDWCFAGGDGEGAVFVREDAVPQGVGCVRASDL